MEDLLLHPRTKKELAIAIAQPSHATLVVGSHGLGLREVVQSLITSWGVSVGDTIFVEGVDKKKISTDQVREMRKLLQLKNKQIVAFVLMAVNGIEITAQNALLKDMENGHQNIRLILATPDENMILTTVRSRMRRIRINKPEKSEYISFLKKSDRTMTEVELLRSYYANNGEFYRTKIKSDDSAIAKEFLTSTIPKRIGILNQHKISNEKGLVLVRQMLTMSHAVLQTAQDPSKLGIWAQRQQSLLAAESNLQKNANARLVFLNLMVEL